jgi:peptide-methionine (S)-S-oxide reductase
MFKTALWRRGLWALLLVPVGIFLLNTAARALDTGMQVPPPAMDAPLAAAPAGDTATAVFAGGCFWGVQGVFQHVKGVTSAVSGYTGGAPDTAQYETVSTGKTGHAEAVKITYDPTVISYGQLLQIYFSVVTDPTELNRQGPDHGTQYRTAIFVQTPEQQKIAETYIAQLGKADLFGKPIVTTLEPFKAFYPAEAYHQDFLALNPGYPYIAINDMPKVENLRRLFPADYREQPALVLTH